MTGRGLVNPCPPVFGPEGRRWALGSRVHAHWFSGLRDGDGDMITTYVERTADGLVVGIRAGGPEAWIITLSFGPMWDSVLPREFTPSQISFLEAG